MEAIIQHLQDEYPLENTSAVFENSEEIDLYNFLKDHDVEAAYEFLQNKQITIETLRYLNEFDLQELIPSSHFGLRVFLRKQLAHWRVTEYGEYANTNTLTNSTNVQEWLNRSINSSVPSSGIVNENFCVEDILKGDRNGQLLLEKKGNFTSDDRIKLCRIIVDYIISYKKVLRKDDFQKLSLDICGCFPGESPDFYYTVGEKKRQAGALYFRYVNSRHKYKTTCSTSLSSTPSRSGTSSALTENPGLQEIDETINENARKWLEFNFEPYEEVTEKWEQTFPLRNRTSYTSNQEYFKHWPIIKSIYGSKLLNIEFGLKYPGKENLLFEEWDKFKLKIFPYLEKNIKDKHYTKILMESKQKSENTQNFVLTILLNTILVPSGRYKSINSSTPKKLHKYTIKQAIDSFAIKVNSILEYHTTIEELKSQCVKDNTTLQPLIIVIDGDDGNIQEHYVYLDGIVYKFTSFVSVLDSTFKIFNTLNLKYPDPSKTVWLFLQKYFYNIATEYDQKSSQIIGLMSSLKD